MFSKADLDRMYELTAGPKVKPGQPDIATPCVRGEGIFLFPGEREYIDSEFPKDSWQISYESDVSDLFKIAGMQWIFRCEDCTPETMPLGCRLYPTLAYIEQWNYRGLILDREYFYAGNCELCDHPGRIEEQFLRNAYGVWAWLCTDPKVASILARISGHARQSGIDGYWVVEGDDPVRWRAIGSG